MALIHGWVGAISGVFIFLVAVTGIGLAFFGELTELQLGDMVRAPDGPHADIGKILRSAEDGYAGEFEPLGLFMPDTRIEGLETTLVYGIAPDAETGTMMISIDPTTAAYKGSFELHHLFAHEFNDFHFTLLMGRPAQIVIALIGFLMVLFTLSGLYLWWPRHGNVRGKALKVQRGGKLKALLFNWHGLAGIWLGLFAVYFALTGTALSVPNWYGPVLAGMNDPPEWDQRFRTACDGEVTPSEAGRMALAAFPGREITSFGFVRGDMEKYILQLRGPGDINVRFGDAMAHVHATCPDQMWTTTLDEQPLPVWLGSQMLSLHGAHIFGRFSELVNVITGLALAFLSVSGIYVFLKRTLPAAQSRKTKKTRRRASSSTRTLEPL